MRLKQSIGALKHTSNVAKQSIQPLNKPSVPVKQIVVLAAQTTERGNRKGRLGNQKGRTVPQTWQFFTQFHRLVNQRYWRLKKFVTLLNHKTWLVAQTLTTATQFNALVNKFASEAHQNNATSNKLTRLINHTRWQVTHFALPDSQTARLMHQRNALTS